MIESQSNDVNHSISNSFNEMQAANIVGKHKAGEKREWLFELTQTSRLPNCLYTGYSFISYTYQNNQQQGHQQPTYFYIQSAVWLSCLGISFI